jgi:regulation of enolase protein 1 (concanavalin A-like superfamily)
MVGRDAELAALKRHVDAAIEGTGCTFFLAGEPGIGKTRLATEAGVYARLRGFRVLAGRCDEQGAAPYQPLVDALREYLDTAGSEQVEQAMPPPVACDLVRIVPQIAGKVKEIPAAAPLPAEAAQHALTAAVQQFFASVTTHDAPVLLFLDDLHWADEGSLALMHALARQAKNSRLLILGTYRDVEVEARHPLERTLATLNRERLAQRILLRRLSEPAVAEMVTALVEEPLPLSFLAPLHRQTEGNPFFVEEVLKHLVEEGAICQEDGRWQIQLREQLSVPQSIKVTIGQRLQRLSEDSRDALTLAAVIGQQFSFDLLLQASELQEERLLAMTEQWLAAHLVVEERLGRQEVFRFQHALIRETLYDEVSLRRKARLHERVGLALEVLSGGTVEEHLEEVAAHFAKARSGTGMEKGVDYCQRAGEKARDLYTNEAAIRHLTAALELLDELPEDEPHLRRRWNVVSNLAKAYSDCRVFERAQEALQNYLFRAQQANYHWGAASAHCEMAWTLREAQQAAGVFRSESSRRLIMEHFEKSLQIADQHGLGTQTAGAQWRARARGRVAYFLSQHRHDLPRAEALLRETLQSPEGLAIDDLHETYGRLMQVCALQGKWDELAAALRQSFPFGAPSSLAVCLGPMEDALERAGQRDEFIAFCEEGKALCAQADVPLPLTQWYLQPTTPSDEFRNRLFWDDFEAPELRPEWQWHDPVQSSVYSLSEISGHLALHAGQGVNLWPPHNMNAPRLLLEVRGDFALETKMVGDWDERSGVSGLLVWKDALNYVLLEKHSVERWQHGSIQLEGRFVGQSRTVGRGLLRGNTFHLRLERTGDRLAALCSTDGLHWLTCGQVVFPVRDPLLVGVAALRGMVVHFDYVQVLGRGDRSAG